ncbi:MAG: HlyD family efflux transporter periplasmic adaptor subunit [Zoogloeaceae bacterium]|jgi:membrane fusion protein (multidrug efflux system)|nr:HlyD family efflux transporter periplasmic adaptor subunit [Zoogloeaceae bacterium]
MTAPTPPSASASTPPSESLPASAPENSGARRRALLVLGAVFLGGALIWAFYWFWVARWRESTDDAYVAGHVVQITAQVGGTTRAVWVEDTDSVAAGAVLVELDDADSQVALRQAEAALARSVREVRALHLNNNMLAAQVAARQVEVDRLTRDLSRRESLRQGGAVPREEIDHAREALNMAKANLSANREQLAANRALTSGTTMENHPAILQAAAQVEDAWLAWSRARIRAPVAGQVARRAVQPGQKVAAGTPLMAVIPLDRLWVEANFKEVQLARMRVGQRVTLSADVYGDKVRYRGRVEGFAAGTGSAFALLPAQNATGNWIKIVQRVPVRIALEAEDLAAHPLRIGLSMRATVDVHDNTEGDKGEKGGKGALMGQVSSDEALFKARARIGEIIRQNSAPDNRRGS